jgi:ribosomal protein S27E
VANVEKTNNEGITRDIFTYKSARNEPATEKTFLEMSCPSCGTPNLVPVNRITYPQETPEHATSKTTILYEPMKTTKCKKCSITIAQPQELIRIKQ